MHHQDLLTSIHTLITSITPFFSALTEEQAAARKQGLERYHLGEFLDAEADLAIAATAGDSDAQYALGEVIRRRDGNLSDAARAWFHLAGEQNHVYALIRLGDAEALEKARKLAQDGVDVDDTDAMLQMYALTRDTYWLSRAGAAGNGEAIYILAILSDRDPRNRDDRHWGARLDSMLIKSAELGFPPAMQWLGNRPFFKHHLSMQTQLLNKRLEKNQLSAVLAYAFALLHFFIDESDIDRYNIRYDRIKGYGLLWLVINSTRQYNRRTEAVDLLAKISPQITSEQVATAIKFASEWKKTHPPLCAYNLSYSELS